jgi:hypothetical protein
LRAEYIFVMLLVTWLVSAVIFGFLFSEISMSNQKLKEHAIKLQMLMDVKQNKEPQ